MGATVCVKQLLLKGSEPNMGDEGGNTPLHIACANGHADVVALLVQAGANLATVDCRDDGPLHYACAFCHDACVAVLLDAGAMVSAPGEFGATPLHHSCSEGREMSVELLMYARADPNQADMYG
eukprot:COSAG01_NODE_22115_length_871_cov_0.804404_1_plen_123_part_10